jgi:hypothetical protein
MNSGNYWHLLLMGLLTWSLTVIPAVAAEAPPTLDLKEALRLLYVHMASAFPWLIIIERCWLGGLRPSSRKNLQTKGVVSSESTKKIQFEEILCYLAFKNTIGSRRGTSSGYPIRTAGSKTNFQRRRPRLLQICGEYLQVVLQKAYRDKDQSNPILLSLRSIKERLPYEDTVPRQVIAQQAHARSEETDTVLVENMPKEFILDPHFELGTSKEREQIVLKIQAEKGQAAIDRLNSLIVDLLEPFVTYGPSFIRSTLSEAKGLRQ